VPDRLNPKTDEEVRVRVALDTAKNNINSFDIKLSYNQESLEFLGYTNDQSITPLWVTTPKATLGTIQFSGVVPGGVSRTYNATNQSYTDLFLVELIFRARASGVSRIDITESAVLLHDGRGTFLPHSTSSLVVSVRPGNEKEDVSIVDTIPPQNLELELVLASKEAQTPLLVVFRAIDNESGIASYQIKEGGTWLVAESPYPVKERLFPSTVHVRVYDRAGNVSEAKIDIPGQLPFHLLVFSGLFLVVAGFYIYKLLK
ncbi:MAG: hypothetical protein ACKOW9_00240, partial [Candidatus Paceibacterota bacterium]